MDEKELGTYQGKEYAMILRDWLAVDRTLLANERTLLAYARTAIGALGAGIAMIKFIGLLWVSILGWGLIAASPLILAVGVKRFLEVRNKFNQAPGKTEAKERKQELTTGRTV